MKKLSNINIKKTKTISKVKTALENLSCWNNSIKNNTEKLDKIKKTKIVDIEDSTKFLMDNSFDVLHKLEMENIDNLNEDEITSPEIKKEDYYNWDFWASNWYMEKIWNNEFFYDYDEKNNEIIIKYYKTDWYDWYYYAEDLTDEEKIHLVETFFKS